VSGYPLMLEGAAISALVVGGGEVGTRKAMALLDAGARVHVVSPNVTPLLEIAASKQPALRITREGYTPEHLVGATVVIAATDDADVNAQVARDARGKGKLVNVANAPDLGNFITPAIHRAGDLVVAVSAGGVPLASSRIRDEICRPLDDRYAAALGELASLRRSLIDAGRRDRWGEVAAALIGPDFCDQVESGHFTARVAEWR
jgi:siroheme synthase-like protein